jgi:predicted exporter
MDSRESREDGLATRADSLHMRALGWACLILVMYVLHQDVWLWRSARPLAFGFLPVGLTYHAIYCLLAAALMWGLARFAWPHHLERDVTR